MMSDYVEVAEPVEVIVQSSRKYKWKAGEGPIVHLRGDDRIAVTEATVTRWSNGEKSEDRVKWEGFKYNSDGKIGKRKDWSIAHPGHYDWADRLIRITPTAIEALNRRGRE